MTKANFQPRTIWIGDNLDIMRGMNSGVVDMIYLDPPFNSDRNYNNPIDGDEDFKDNWTLDDLDVAEHGELAEHCPAAHAVIEAAKHAQGKGTMAYCIFMAIRILEMKRILNPKTGHLFLHCDDSAGHHIRNLLDAILGKKAYRNHIVWKRSTWTEERCDSDLRARTPITSSTTRCRRRSSIPSTSRRTRIM